MEVSAGGMSPGATACSAWRVIGQCSSLNTHEKTCAGGMSLYCCMLMSRVPKTG